MVKVPEWWVSCDSLSLERTYWVIEWILEISWVRPCTWIITGIYQKLHGEWNVLENINIYQPMEEQFNQFKNCSWMKRLPSSSISGAKSFSSLHSAMPALPEKITRFFRRWIWFQTTSLQPNGIDSDVFVLPYLEVEICRYLCVPSGLNGSNILWNLIHAHTSCKNSRSSPMVFQTYCWNHVKRTPHHVSLAQPTFLPPKTTAFLGWDQNPGTLVNVNWQLANGCWSIQLWHYHGQSLDTPGTYTISLAGSKAWESPWPIHICGICPYVHRVL